MGRYMKQNDFPSILKSVRKKKNLTMIAVAQQAGIPLPIYKMIENGTLIPDREKLKLLCSFFDLEF